MDSSSVSSSDSDSDSENSSFLKTVYRTQVTTTANTILKNEGIDRRWGEKKKKAISMRKKVIARSVAATVR